MNLFVLGGVILLLGALNLVAPRIWSKVASGPELEPRPRTNLAYEAGRFVRWIVIDRRRQAAFGARS